VTVSQGTGTNLHVVCDSGCSSSAGFADNGAFTFGTTAVNPIAGVFDDTATNTATENSAAIARITASKALHVNFRNASGTEIGTSSNPIQVTPGEHRSNATAVKVDNSAVTQPVSGTVSITANSSVNVSQVNGSTVSTSATGVQKVGVVGNAGATVDSTVGAGTAPTNQVVVGSIYNATAPAPTTGQAMAQQADQAGNLRIAPGIATTTLSAWTSATSLNATQTIYTNSGAPAVLLQLVQTTTLSAGAVTVEVSYDGTNWVTISADAVIDPTSTTMATVSLPYTVQASTNKPILLLAKGAQAMRVKLSTQITGSGSVTPNYALLSQTPVQQTTLGAGSATIGALTANQSVNLSQLAGTTTDTNSGNKSAGTLRVVLATDQPQLTNKLLVTPDANSAVNISQMNGVTVTMGNGASGTGVQRVTLASDSTGQVALAAGSATIGALTANQSVNNNQWNGAALASPDANSYVISPNAATATSGAAASACNILSAASTNATSCKGSAGNLYGYEIYNTSTTVYYLRLYNLASAPTCSSATGFIRTIPIPPASAAGGVGGAVSNYSVPVNFGTGIGYCITAGSSSTDNTSAATGVFGEVRYK
jgi:hypothetical protein